MRTPRIKVRRRWPWALGASAVMATAALCAAPTAGYAATQADVSASAPADGSGSPAPDPPSLWTWQNDVTNKYLDGNTDASPSNVVIPIMYPIYSLNDPDMGAVYAKSGNGGPYQTWKVTMLSWVGDGPSFIATIQSTGADGKCLDSNQYDSTSSIPNPVNDPDMGAVYLKSCTPGNVNQQWLVEYATVDGFLSNGFNLQNMGNGGKCLDSNASVGIPSNTNPPGSDPDMGAVYAKSCTPANYNQQWLGTYLGRAS